MTTFAISVGAIGVAVYGVVKALQALAGTSEPMWNRFWPLIAIILGIGAALLPGALDYVCELAGGDLMLTASLASKILTGAIGGGMSATYWSIWRTTVCGR